MTEKKCGKTAFFENPPSICSSASIAGKKEGEGPLSDDFDMILEDEYLGEKSWEQAEGMLQKETAALALKKIGLTSDKLDYIISGDLQNQCTASHYGQRDMECPYIGIYGACSTMTEGLMLSAMLIDGGFGENILCGTSSHFCSAEKQFRFPLEYGGIRTPTSQWTVTGSGFCIVSKDGEGPFITHATTGTIVDLGVCDINNMGGAMAPAAADTLLNHFKDTKRTPDDYDLIITGDLGLVGSELFEDLMKEKGYDISEKHKDCGLMIFDRESQDVHAGGSGCGCSGSVFCGHIMKEFRRKNLKRIAIMSTGALMNPQIVLQGESIPSIAHLVVVESKEN